MSLGRDSYFISTDPALLDLEFLQRGLNSTYWAANRSREVIESSIKGSLCFGVYEKESKRQVGFARVVTDKVTFSWVCDVFVAEANRKHGLGKWLIESVVNHPDVKRTTCILGTRDAHGLYEKFGFVRSELMRRPTEGANQALLPTPTSVTHPAGAGCAPAAVAADL